MNPATCRFGSNRPGWLTATARAVIDPHPRTQLRGDQVVRGVRASWRPRSARSAPAERGPTGAGARGVRPECCTVAEGVTPTALPLSTAAGPKENGGAPRPSAAIARRSCEQQRRGSFRTCGHAGRRSVALVTGASRRAGIGCAIAHQLLAVGSACYSVVGLRRPWLRA